MAQESTHDTGPVAGPCDITNEQVNMLHSAARKVRAWHQDEQGWERWNDLRVVHGIDSQFRMAPDVIVRELGDDGLSLGERQEDGEWDWNLTVTHDDWCFAGNVEHAIQALSRLALSDFEFVGDGA